MRVLQSSARLRSAPETVDDRLPVTRDEENNCAVAYITDSPPITLDPSGISSRQFSGYQINSCTGGRQTPGNFVRQSERQFTPPATSPEQDWVLVVTNRE